MVYRVYVEKKKGQTHEADGLFREVKDFLQIKGLSSVRVLNRYDVEKIEEKLFGYAVNTVFSEPQVDNVTYELPEGWKWCRLGDCSSLISKGTTPKGGKEAAVYNLCLRKS